MARILLIDDDAAVRTALARLLAYDGHIVTAAANGVEGLRLLDDGVVDVVIADVVMPGIDGLELIRHMRRRKSAPPVIAISGGGRSMTTPYLEMALQFGAAAALQKPVDLHALRAHIARLAPAGPTSAAPADNG